MKTKLSFFQTHKNTAIQLSLIGLICTGLTGFVWYVKNTDSTEDKQVRSVKTFGVKESSESIKLSSTKPRSKLKSDLRRKVEILKSYPNSRFVIHAEYSKNGVIPENKAVASIKADSVQDQLLSLGVPQYSIEKKLEAKENGKTGRVNVQVLKR